MANKLKKVFIYAIPLICLMSHIIFSDNASAVDTVLNLNGYGIINSAASPRVNCTFNDTSLNKNNVVSCGGSNSNSGTPTILKSFYTVDQWNMQRADIVEFDLIVWSPTNLSSLDGFTPGIISTPYPFRVMSITQKASNVFTNDIQSITNGTGGTLYNGNAYFSIFHYSLSYVGGNNVAYNLGWSSANDIFVWSGETLTFRMFNVVQWRLTGEGSTDQQNEVNATNDSVQQSESEGNTSQTDADTATQSLMTAGANIISALTSAPATDCNINISTTGNSSAFTSAIGNLNLCSDVPSGVLTLVQGMVALVFTPIVLYYVYSILTLIYAQFKEYNS